MWDDIEDKAIYCSDGLATMYGVASGVELAALLSSHEADRAWVHPEDRDRFDEAARTATEMKRGYDIWDFMAGESFHKRRLSTHHESLAWIRLRRPRIKYVVVDTLRKLRHLLRERGLGQERL